MRILLDTSFLYGLMASYGDSPEERKSPYDPDDVIAMLREHRVEFVPLKAHHAACSLETPIPHRDPFDELLLVQAQEEGLKLLTADRHLAGHPLAVTV